MENEKELGKIQQINKLVGDAFIDVLKMYPTYNNWNGFEYLTFPMEIYGFLVQVYLHISETEQDRLSGELSFCFRGNHDLPLDFSEFGEINVLGLFGEIQPFIKWGHLRTIEGAKEGSVQIHLNRIIDLNLSDIEEMHKNNMDSNLLRNFKRLKKEVIMLTPIFNGIYTGQIDIFDSMIDLLGEQHKQSQPT